MVSPASRLSNIGPKSASNASLAQNPFAQIGLARQHLFSLFKTVLRSWKPEHTLPREFGVYHSDFNENSSFGRNQPVCE